MLGHGIGYASDVSITPPPSGSRSLTGSPPLGGGLTPEQRELRRQRDQARRDTKAATRIWRADSGSSYGPSPTPSMADLSVTSSPPVYTAAPTQISLLVEPATLVPNQYMPSPYTSPLPDQNDMFASQYPPPYVMDPYASTYPAATGSSLPAHYAYVLRFRCYPEMQ